MNVEGGNLCSLYSSQQHGGCKYGQWWDTLMNWVDSQTRQVPKKPSFPYHYTVKLQPMQDEGKTLCVCCGMWRWWGKGLVCMTSSPKYVFSLHSASFLPSLSCLSPCVFVCLCVCFILSLYSDSCVCWCLNMLFAAVTLSYMLCYIRACLREGVCVWQRRDMCVYPPAGIWGSYTRWKPSR